GHRSQRPYPSGDAEGGRQCRLPYRYGDRLPATSAWGRPIPRSDEGRRRQVTLVAWHHRGEFRARTKAPRAHRQAAAGLIIMRMPLQSQLWLSAAAALLAGVVTGAVASYAVVAAEEATATIDNFTFAPARLTVKAGTTVTWRNEDDIPHTVTASSRLFKSKALDTDDSFSFTFTEPGTYEYFCSLHPRMTATVVVEPGNASK